MERFNEDLVLTTSQAAELLSVHPSTIKRWCTDDELRSEKTDGGHRRIHLDDVLTAASEREISTYLDPFAPYQAHVFSAVLEAEDSGEFHRVHSLAMGWLSRGHLKRVGWLYQELGRRPGIPFPAFCDEGVRGLLEQIGLAWQEGRLRVGEEHLVTQTLMEALLHLRAGAHLGAAPLLDADLPAGRVGTAVVGSMEGNQHHLGGLCVRLVLERFGWRVLYLGPDVPVEDFATLQRSRGAQLVCVSFASPAIQADVNRCVRILAEFYSRAHPYSLALGGGAIMDPTVSFGTTPFSEVGVFPSIRSLVDGLEDGFAATSEMAEMRI